MSVQKVRIVEDKQKDKVVTKSKYNLTEFGMSRRLKQDPIQEIVAEFGAEILRRIIGSDKDTSGNCYSYIESYAKQMKTTVLGACLKVLKETSEVVKLILETASDCGVSKDIICTNNEVGLCEKHI